MGGGLHWRENGWIIDAAATPDQRRRRTRPTPPRIYEILERADGARLSTSARTASRATGCAWSATRSPPSAPRFSARGEYAEVRRQHVRPRLRRAQRPRVHSERSCYNATLCHVNLSLRRDARCAARRKSPRPRGEEKYCRDCWDKKLAVEEIVAREFALKRYIRAHSAEKYLIYHSTLKRPCGQLIVVDDGYDLFLTMMLYPSFAWDEAAYHLEGDPEGRSFGEILVDVVAAEVIEPWGGGKWHLEVFRSTNPEPEDWNGEM